MENNELMDKIHDALEETIINIKNDNIEDFDVVNSKIDKLNEKVDKLIEVLNKLV